MDTVFIVCEILEVLRRFGPETVDSTVAESVHAKSLSNSESFTINSVNYHERNLWLGFSDIEQQHMNSYENKISDWSHAEINMRNIGKESREVYKIWLERHVLVDFPTLLQLTQKCMQCSIRLFPFFILTQTKHTFQIWVHVISPATHMLTVPTFHILQDFLDHFFNLFQLVGNFSQMSDSLVNLSPGIIKVYIVCPSRSLEPCKTLFCTIDLDIVGSFLFFSILTLTNTFSTRVILSTRVI